MDGALCHLWFLWLYLKYSSACFFHLARLNRLIFKDKRNKAKPHNAPWFLFSIFLFVPSFSIIVMKSHRLESVLQAESKPTDVTIIRVWAYWHICFHLSSLLTPLCEGHLHLSAGNPIIWRGLQCERTIWSHRWQTSLFVEQKQSPSNEYKFQKTINCTASNVYLSNAGWVWPTMKQLLTVSLIGTDSRNTTFSSSQHGCVNTNNESTQSPELC